MSSQSGIKAADRMLVGAGGVCGAAGVALSAAAAHAGGGNFGTAATFLLAHAPVFVAVGLAGASPFGTKILQAAAFILLIGVLLFSGDLLMRDYVGHRLFPMATPTGGIVMILGWLGIAAAALAPRGRTGISRDRLTPSPRQTQSTPGCLDTRRATPHFNIGTTERTRAGPKE